MHAVKHFSVKDLPGLLPSSAWDHRASFECGSLLGLRAELAAASELAGVERFAFADLVGRRGIPRHYGEDDIVQDLDYARRQ